MANDAWTGATNDNVGTGTNWSLGVIPANGDTALLDRAAPNGLGSNLAALLAITGLKWDVGPEFNKGVGNSTTALEFGTGATIRFRGRDNLPCYLQPTTTLNSLHVFSTNMRPNSLVLKGAATCTVTRIQGGKVLLAGTMTHTLLLGLNGGSPLSLPLVEAESGITITAVRWDGGILTSAVTPASVYGFGGKIEHTKGAAATMTLLELSGSCRFIASAVTPTFTTLRVASGGVFDATDNHYALVITDGEVRAGGRLLAPNQLSSSTNGIVMLGGFAKLGPGFTNTVTHGFMEL